MKELFFLSTLLMISTTALADLYDVPKVNTLENRNYYLHDEVTLQAGYLPLGAFSKYLAGGLSYTHAFSDFTSWEVINGSYAAELASGLKNDLIGNFGADPSTFPVLHFLVTTNLVITPLYSKNLLFNSSIVHSQASFVAGGGVANFTTATLPTIDVGIILRYFLTPSSSLKFDFRDNIFLTSDPTINNNLTLIVGYALSLGGGKKNVDSDF